MALITFLLWTVFTVVDFCFNKVMRDTYPDKDVLTAFLGSFRGWAGFLCLVVQLFFTSSLISRLGVGTTISFHPTYLSLSTLWMTLGFGYVSVYAAKMGDHVLLYTIQDSSFQLLYNPVPLERRARIRGFIDGYIKPLSMAAAGVLLLLGTRYLDLPSISAIGFVLALGWTIVALTTKKGYIRALLENLQSDSPALRHAAATALGKLKDPSSLRILSSSLRSENPDRVIAAMQFLEGFGTEKANEALAELLDHPDAHVRATAVSTLGRRAGAEYVDRLTPLLADPDPRTAVSTLGRRAGAEYVDRLTPLLADPDPRVRANAIEALAAAGDPALVEKLRPLLEDPSTRARINTVLTIAAIKGVSAALELLPQIAELTRGNERSRFTATFALGRLPLDQSMDLLAVLLRDPELRIRCEAAKALGRIGASRVIPPLVEALAGPAELRRQARRSLAAIVRNHGTETTRELESAAINTPRAEIRSELADVLGRVKDPQVMDTLLQLLKDPEWRVRWKVLKAFERLSRDGPLTEAVRTALFDYARKELADYRQSLVCTEAIIAQPSTNAERVLARALEEDRAKIVERVFHMLGIVCGRDRMMPILEKLRSTDPRVRADALEALETLAPKTIAREVLGLLEPAPTVQSAEKPPADPSLAALAVHSKPWVRACTARYLGQNPLGKADSLLENLVQDHDSLVRETALYAGWQAFKDTWMSEVEAASHSPDPALHRSAQKILLAKSGAAAGAETPAGRSKHMLLTVEKALFLKSAPIFAEVEGEELAALADIALEHEFQPGEIIFEENQAPHHLYLIVEGKVEVFRRVNDAERPLANLGEKECFGEMAILDDQPRSASVRAIELTTVLKIDRGSFRELILERPQIAFAIFRILSGRLRHQNLEADSIPTVYSGGQYA
jgi:HEAT repeat protein